MKLTITDLRVTPVSVPHIEPEFMSTGLRKGVTQILLEIETNPGIN